MYLLILKRLFSDFRTKDERVREGREKVGWIDGGGGVKVIYGGTLD